jgi:hypothetical protein
MITTEPYPPPMGMKPGVLYFDSWGELADEECIGRLYYFCPCGCGNPVELPVCLPEHKKPGSKIWGWKAADPVGPSIMPSVNFLEGCKSHYTITNGGISWTFPNPPPPGAVT